MNSRLKVHFSFRLSANLSFPYPSAIYVHANSRVPRTNRSHPTNTIFKLFDYLDMMVMRVVPFRLQVVVGLYNDAVPATAPSSPAPSSQHAVAHVQFPGRAVQQ